MSVKLGSLRQRLLAGAMACAACATALPARAQERAEPKQHVVKRGDTLWDIAHTYLGNAFLWPRVYDANKRLIKDPHWIYPGQRFIIVPGAPGEPASIQLVEAPVSNRTVFYRPEQPMDTLALERRPLVERGEFLSASWVGDPAALAPIGRMLDRVKVGGQADRLAQIATIADRIYVRLDPGAVAPAAGTQLMMVRVVRALPPYGSIIAPTAMLVVERANQDVLVVHITKQYDAALRGQLVIAVPAFTPLGIGVPRPVERGAEGEMIGFLAEEPLHTIGEQAFVSLGRAQGLRVGDIVEAYAPERPTQAAPGVLVPSEPVARLVLLKVGDRTATARVLSMSQPALQRGLKARLVARVP